MKKFFITLLEGIAKSLKSEQPSRRGQQVEALEPEPSEPLVPNNTLSLTPTTLTIKAKKPKPLLAKVQTQSAQEIIARDFTEMMEIPFLALSMRRIKPIVYEDKSRGIKVRVTAHREHFLASIYDWDIIIFVASKMQEIMNNGTDIPPRTITFPRHEILKALMKHDGKKEEKDLKASLSRLRLTGIETTIRNQDCRYEAGFGFLDSWGYTKRKDIREIHITLSQWLYDGVCAKGALLKVSNDYFEMTSGLKRFLYRTARKHVGIQNHEWEFSIEKLYEKSGSEQEFKKFKYDLKKIIKDNNIPGYFLELVEKENKSFIRFINLRKEVKKMLS
jgi:plasmid replication initiation protein